MKKFSHAKANALLAAYAAQELAPGKHQAIEAHLGTCAICQRDLVEIGHISSLLRSFAFTDASSASSVSGSHQALQLPLSRSRTSSRHTAQSIPARRTASRPRLMTLIAALLTLTLIISTAAIFTYASQGSATLSGKEKTPTPIVPCLTPTSSVPTSTPTITLSPTSSATPTGTLSPTPSAPTPTPAIKSNASCTTPVPGETTTPTPVPSPTISPTHNLPTPTPNNEKF